jgi:glutamate racemase
MKIGVLATPATLQSPRYAVLKEEFAAHITVLEPDCSTWASLIENGQENDIALSETIQPLLQQDVDVIVS